MEDSPGSSAPRQLRLVLLTYEFTYEPFSGNGMLSQCLVRSLLRRNHTHVTVWCCRPPSTATNSKLLSLTSNNANSNDRKLDESSNSNLTVISSVVHNGWKRNDRHSCWEEFTFDRLDESDQRTLQGAIGNASAVCAVDWTGACAYRTLPELLLCRTRKPPPLMVYLNYRVFALGVSDNEHEKEWYQDMERRALRDARVVVTLSKVDQSALAKLLARPPNPPIKILFPPLRSDLHHWANDAAKQDREVLKQSLPDPLREALLRVHHGQQDDGRCFLTCMVRLSPEKETMRFVQFLEKAGKHELNDRLVPVLAGASSDPDYAERVRSRLLRVAPNSVVLSSFLDAPSLASLMAFTAVNFHPSSYDAYGMTVVEAAAFGVPSVVSSGDRVGATALLGDAFLPIDMEGVDDLPDVTATLDVLNDTQSLQKVGAKARERALSWDEGAYAEGFLNIIENS